MTTKMDTKFTVQGRDIPVPVGSGVPRTGSTRSSAIDCSVSPVGNQAGAHAELTGIATEKAEMEVKGGLLVGCLGASTPSTSRLEDQEYTTGEEEEDDGMQETETTEMTDNAEYIDLTCSEDEKPTKKKKRRIHDSTLEEEQTEETGNSNAKKQGQMVRLIKEMDKMVRRVARIVTENPNTKREIKECSLTMTSLAAQMTTKEMIKTVEGRKQTASEGKNTATQTEGKHEKKRIEKEQIAKANTYDDFVSAKELEWPEKVYTVTKHEEGTITQVGKEFDLIIWDEGKDANTQTREALNRYQELQELEGEMALLYLTTKSVDAQGTHKTRDQVITRLKTDGSEKDCYNKLKNFMRRMKGKQRTKVAVYPPGEDGDGSVLRKMAECVFAGTGIECRVRYKEKRRAIQKGGRRTDAIIVTQEGKTYADLLRGVKDAMKNQESEVTDQIEAIRKTKEGAMLITLKAGEDKTKRIRGMISKMGEEVKTRVSTAGRERKATIHIKGMDAITTKKEIMDVIERETGVDRQTIRMGELRPYYGSSRAVTVTMPETGAKRMVTRGRLRIELNWCKVEERVNLTQCYRCWGYGHTADTCKEETDRRDDCKRCGESGHRRRECEKDQRCPICNKEGHSAGTGGARRCGAP